MNLTVAAVGQRMPVWVQTAWKEYARRFGRGMSLQLKEIPLGKRSRNADIESLRQAEGDALLAAVPSGHRLIALDEKGRQWSTLELAEKLEHWMREERGVCFLVGGPDGLPDTCKTEAHETWSLGRLTLPHPLVRAILAEQLYRAWTVTQNHPYHRS
ncbi:MAG: 23S rRNA (pseudouridine(1915)-N(3))-methyltransferase RlmH [Xanthomonadales bacterium]|nr:23S rRNA (pseudouridine(1915)-N(3))-methyltransferase RlmH [Gammaproteobacteria bacterium]MBT8054495.1 23S rRNA (pseudouridine(1915)-N(3))-methyltransferase RlmH [Gammaproteobacteria bacterium]NND57710.1 23S rRNA (pseudouridine(1915)-N(3))-methyltransferase RlmH [Xanthomonadales bacterium]NNK52619.1 23S rRNA (pseudouridine(1915)-N(3))-methyltransferase RlmH [Xanthomonadales bacterium]